MLGSLGFWGVLKAAAARSLGQLPPDYFFLSPEFPSPRRGVRGEAFYHSLSQTLTSETELYSLLRISLLLSSVWVASKPIDVIRIALDGFKRTIINAGEIYVFFILSFTI